MSLPPHSPLSPLPSVDEATLHEMVGKMPSCKKGRGAEGGWGKRGERFPLLHIHSDTSCINEPWHGEGERERTWRLSGDGDKVTMARYGNQVQCSNFHH